MDSSSMIIGGWIAAGLTLFMFSLLYKDNLFFRFGEHLFLGLAVGYALANTIYLSLINKWFDPLFKEGNLWLIFPTILGLMLYTRFFPKIAWISRITFAFIVGYGSGIAIPRIIAGALFPQIEKFISPLLVKPGIFATKLDSINFYTDYFSGILMVIGIFSVLIYFFFSLEHKGVVGGISKIGIYFVMIAFGASFGYTVMGRMSLLIGRSYDLIEFAQPKYYYASIVLLLLIILVLVFYEMYIRKQDKQLST